MFHNTMISKLFGALGLLTLVAILSVAPAFGQSASDQTGSVTGGVMAYKATSSDGTVVVIRAGHALSGQPLAVGIGFFNGATGNAIQHQNYAITVTQDNAIVLSNQNGHTHTGTDTQTTSALTSNNPIDIKITLNGVGLPTVDPSTWTGVKGEVLDFGPSAADTTTPETTVAPTGDAAIPEFGPVASIVLAIAVLSMVVFAAKTRVIPRL